MARKRSRNKDSQDALWGRSGATVRLLVGALVIALVGLMGLTPKILFNTEITWPYASFIAAVGWGRYGFAFRPMVLLILFGLAQDVSANAPIGCFALINLTVYGLSGAASTTLDLDRAPTLRELLPVPILAVAFFMIWGIASLSTGHGVRWYPLAAAYAMTFFLHVLIAPVFLLGRQNNEFSASTA